MAYAAQVEKHGAAAEKRFVVPVELDWVIGAKRSEQLSFAAGPLEKRARG
jgi:hypothetical protein